MKNYKQILEAVNRGIQLALDDYEDNEPNSSLSQQNDVIDSEDVIKQRIELNKTVIDLGLPSGTLWCKYNLGCDYELLNNHPKNSTPKDWIGDYYAWGELNPNKPKYDWNSYKFYDGPINITDNIDEHYITKYGLNDKSKLVELQPEDDAAYQNMHFYNFKFHIPTKNQFEELLEYTEQYVAGEYYKEELDLNGVLFISKINEKSIFIPTTGYYTNEKIKNLSQGWYLSSSLYTNNEYVDCLCIVDGSAYVGVTNREEGACIRPVLNL